MNSKIASMQRRLVKILLDLNPDIGHRKMFGEEVYLFQGNIFCGIESSSLRYLLRIPDKNIWTAMLAQKGYDVFAPGGVKLANFILLPVAIDDDELESVIRTSYEVAKLQPEKKLKNIPRKI